MANNVSGPSDSPLAPQCGMLLDRHVPKTAGTTVRTMLRRNAQLGSCEYWGYDLGRSWVSRVGFRHRALGELVAELGARPPPRRRLCAEGHIVGGSFWAELAWLRASVFARQCRVVVMLRVREPLAWYRSFYDWAVRPRQRTGDARWGANFTDWLPPNMQSRYLLHGSAGQPSELAAELAAKPDAGAPRRLSAARWAELDGYMRAADVVAPLERLDDSLALAAHLAGFLSTVAYQRTAPAPVRGPWDAKAVWRGSGKAVPNAADFCDADAGVARACVAAVNAVAGDDHRLHALATSLFVAQWEKHGDAAAAAQAHAPPQGGGGPAAAARPAASGARRRWWRQPPEAN